MSEEIISAVEKVFNLTIHDLQKYSRVIPTAFFYTSENNYYVPDVDFSDREKAMKLLRKTAKKIKATMVIIMYPAFVSYSNWGVMPSLATGRRTAAVIYGEDKYSNSCILQEYEIDENNSVILGEKTIIPNGSTGALTGIIKR